VEIGFLDEGGIEGGLEVDRALIDAPSILPGKAQKSTPRGPPNSRNFSGDLWKGDTARRDLTANGGLCRLVVALHDHDIVRVEIAEHRVTLVDRLLRRVVIADDIYARIDITRIRPRATKPPQDAARP
jgi:hypothetical protein